MQKPKQAWIEAAMKIAIEDAHNAGTAFGATLMDSGGNVVLKAVNTGKRDGPLAHAEKNLLDMAIKKGLKLWNYYLISTCEPCPMCMAAIVWSKVNAVYFGLEIQELKSYYNQIDISAIQIVEKSFYKLEIFPFILREDVLKLVKKVRKGI